MEETKEYDLCDIYTNADETCLFLNLQPSISLTFCGNNCYGGTIKTAGFWCSSYVYSAGSSNKLPPLVTGKYTSPCCFKMLKKLSTKHDANTNSCITTRIFEKQLSKLDRKIHATH